MAHPPAMISTELSRHPFLANNVKKSPLCLCLRSYISYKRNTFVIYLFFFASWSVTNVATCCCVQVLVLLKSWLPFSSSSSSSSCSIMVANGSSDSGITPVSGMAMGADDGKPCSSRSCCSMTWRCRQFPVKITSVCNVCICGCSKLPLRSSSKRI